MEVKLCEIMKTIQGEGRLQGVPSVLIRMCGCNLKCRWCDTEKTISASDTVVYKDSDLIYILKEMGCSHVVITGGEPTIHNELVDLISVLKENGFHVTVETNGTKYIDLKCDLVSISPKLSNSNPEELVDDEIKKYDDKRMRIDVIKKYIQNHDYQLKFVCDDNDEDFNEVEEILSQLGHYNNNKVMIMAESSTKKELEEKQLNIIRKCIKHNLRYANRLQLQIWDQDKEI